MSMRPHRESGDLLRVINASEGHSAAPRCSIVHPVCCTLRVRQVRHVAVAGAYFSFRSGPRLLWLASRTTKEAEHETNVDRSHRARRGDSESAILRSDMPAKLGGAWHRR